MNDERNKTMKITKKLFGIKRKAFSPVIASLILMLLAVAAGVVVYGYTMGWIGGATGAPGGTQGEMQYDSIRIDVSDSNVTMYVRNTGSKNLTIDYIYIEGTGYSANNATLIDITSTSLTVNSVMKIQVDTSSIDSIYTGQTFVADYSYEVKVVCADGTTVSQSEVAVA